jgi:methylation protein EvaC
MDCRVCGKSNQPFMTFGRMPIANGFIKKGEEEKEQFFELKPVFCSECFTFQISEQPDPSLMFHDNYAFFSRTSKAMIEHFQVFSEYLKKELMPNEKSFIVELGSNDGILLENFAREGIRHLGVEPSKNVADVAKERGVNTLNEFFNITTANNIRKNYGQCDVLVAANVMCHIPNINEIAEAAAALIRDGGFLVFEDPYLGSMIEKVSYDQLYDEHVFMFSIHSVENIFSKFGLVLHDAQFQKTHGGSMRYILKKAKAKTLTQKVKKMKEEEARFGLNNSDTYFKFAEECEASKIKFLKKLQELKAKGKTIVGYGATSKSTTILNYCGIGIELIDYISDTTPIKQNKLSPGMHIPIKDYSYFDENPSDAVVIFAWNHFKEILEKENAKRHFDIVWISHIDEKFIFPGVGYDSFIEPTS